MHSFLRLFVAFLAPCLTACAQQRTLPAYFEGSLTYRASILEIRDPSIDSNALLQVLDDSTLFTYRQGYSLERFGSAGSNQWIFHPSANRLYLFDNKTDTINWIDGRVRDRPPLKTERRNRGTTVRGIPCEELVLTFAEGRQNIYYFNPDTLRIDPVWTSNTKWYNRDMMNAEMKAIYLRCDLVYPKYTLSIELCDVRPHPVDQSVFSVPANRPLKEIKSPIAGSD